MTICQLISVRVGCRDFCLSHYGAMLHQVVLTSACVPSFLCSSSNFQHTFAKSSVHTMLVNIIHVDRRLNPRRIHHRTLKGLLSTSSRSQSSFPSFSLRHSSLWLGKCFVPMSARFVSVGFATLRQLSFSRDLARTSTSLSRAAFSWTVPVFAPVLAAWASHRTLILACIVSQ